MNRWLSPLVTLVSILFYWLAVAIQEPAENKPHEEPAKVVITPPVQVLIYAGDRFMAANIESIRAAASATVIDSYDFRLRAHEAASKLNPCHEDNYWIGNASLSWGGAVEQGFELLRNATHCRFWDEWPAFFYGFNQNFFYQDITEAQRVLELAAKRSTNNAALFRTYATMIGLDKIKNVHLALKMLKYERDKATDPKLRGMLNERVIRLNGLLTLREAQISYEKKRGKPLKHPQELLESGLLEKYPDDPLKLGYEFRDQTFHLRQFKTQ